MPARPGKPKWGGHRPKQALQKFAASKADARRKQDFYNASMNKLPSTQIMHGALLNRDTTFEGVFYVGVKTTGIFCRPTCPAKKPKPENVEYFSSPQEALYGGYRPCLRCSPLDKDKKASELVERLRDAVERSPTRRVSGTELQAEGIDTSTARRQFQRH